jgi:hypothetical protein
MNTSPHNWSHLYEVVDEEMRVRGIGSVVVPHQAPAVDPPASPRRAPRRAIAALAMVALVIGIVAARFFPL